METTSNTSEALKKTIYSAAFNSLTYYGAWTIQTSSSVKKKAYAIYQLTMLGIALTLVYSLCSNMLVIFGDIKKMSWNLCVTTLFGGALMKCIFLFRRRQILNSLRVSLHEDFKSRNSSENVVVQNESLKLYKKIRWIFHGSLSAFGTIWIVSRFLNHMLPIPLELPVDFDMEVYLNYVAIFALFTFMAVAGITFAVEQELAMFAIMVQIRREYEIFLSDIPKLNEGLHKECTQKICRRNLIINPWLQQTNTKIWLKELMIRQQTLLKYTQIFEDCYNQSMFVQVLVVTIVAVAIAVQCILLNVVYLPEFTFQLGYLVLVLIDVFLVCFMGSNLSTQCRAVGHALYDTRWYEMDLSVQRDLSFMMLISQNPATITILKASEVDLHAFQKILQHIYSWLTLFRQLTFKMTK